MKLVELLAPAKDYAAAAAAVDYGADAVYIGGARFGARQAAGNSAEEIARVVEYAHRFGVRVHATLNTLVWDAAVISLTSQLLHNVKRLSQKMGICSIWYCQMKASYRQIHWLCYRKVISFRSCRNYI